MIIFVDKWTRRLIYLNIILRLLGVTRANRLSLIHIWFGGEFYVRCRFLTQHCLLPRRGDLGSNMTKIGDGFSLRTHTGISSFPWESNPGFPLTSLACSHLNHKAMVDIVQTEKRSPHLLQNFHSIYLPRTGTRYLPNLKHL